MITAPCARCASRAKKPLSRPYKRPTGRFFIARNIAPSSGKILYRMPAASVAACCSCNAMIWRPEPAKNANRAHGARGWIRGPWSALRYASTIGGADGFANRIPDVRLSIGARGPWPAGDCGRRAQYKNANIMRGNIMFHCQGGR
jgi:hypothetical protein